MNGVLERDSTGIDDMDDELGKTIEAAKVARSFLKFFDDPDLPLRLFHAIVELTIKTGSETSQLEYLEFNSIELSEYIINTFPTLKHFGPQDKAKRTEWITDQWNKPSKRLPEYETGLKEHAARMKLDHIPTLFKKESTGGRGNQTCYRLKYIQLSNKSTEPNTPDASPTTAASPQAYPHESLPTTTALPQVLTPDAETVIYTTTRANKLPPWARWLDRLEISGKTRFAFATFMTIGYALTWAWIIFSAWVFFRLWQDQTIELWQFRIFYPGMFVVLPIAAFCIPFFRLGIYKIIPSPFLFTLFQSVTHDLFLELSRADGRHRIDPDKPRSIRLVSYSARCPICNGFVSIDGGGWKYRGRLIGHCNESPREHVWSFDHVTLSGRRLH